MELDNPHWFRDCLVCGTDYLLPVCPHTETKCPEGHAVVTDPADCDCRDNRELLEYPCNCKTCQGLPLDEPSDDESSDEEAAQ